MNDTIVTITKCVVTAAIAGAVIWLSVTNDGSNDIIKVIAATVIGYMFGQKSEQ